MRFKLLALATLLIFLIGCINVEEEFCPPPLDEFEEEILTESDSFESFPNLDLPKKVITEGELVEFPNLKALDPDGDLITYTFSHPLNENGEWQTQKGDKGEYKITITASDGENVISQNILLIVESSNKAPLIQTMKIINLKAGEVLDINPKVNDPDNDEVQISFSGWKTELPYTTTNADAGEHTILISAFDGESTTTEELTVIVNRVNHAPKLDKISDILIYEEDKIMVVAVATDSDNDLVTYTYSVPLDENGIWQTQKGDKGEYDVELTASDGDLTDIINFKIVVLSFNEPPVLYGVKDLTVIEGDLVSLNINADDPEGEPVEISYSGWMTSTTKQTDHNDAGEHAVIVSAFDGEKTTKQQFTITVTNQNRAPVFQPGAFE